MAGGYTRVDWSKALLDSLGNHNQNNQVIDWLVAWTQFESAGPPAPSAAFNLLNTTEHNTPGVVSDFNKVGVVNYDTFGHGVQANAKVLRNGLYPKLLEALSGNEMSVLFAASPAIGDELVVWGTGSKQAAIATLAAHGPLETAQVFPGVFPDPVPPSPAPTPEPVPDSTPLAAMEKMVGSVQSNLNAALKTMGLLKKAIEVAMGDKDA